MSVWTGGLRGPFREVDAVLAEHFRHCARVHIDVTPIVPDEAQSAESVHLERDNLSGGAHVIRNRVVGE